MKCKSKYTPVICFLLIFCTARLQLFACTCLTEGTQTGIASIKNADLVVKGKIIAVTNFVYYDTVGQTSASMPFDISKNGYLLRKLKRYTLVVENRYKSPVRMKDTVEIVTGNGGGDCGFDFQVGGEYLVFASMWREKKVYIRKKKKAVMNQVIPGVFSTSICEPTQRANQAEEERIRQLLK